MYDLTDRRSARNYLARLPLNIKTTLVEKLHALAIEPYNPTLDTKPIKGGLGYRLRVGKYRVIYTIQDDILVIEIVKIRSRGDIYGR